MIVIVALITLVVLGLLGILYANRNGIWRHDTLQFVSGIVVIVAGVSLVLWLTLIPITRLKANAFIAKHDELREMSHQQPYVSEYEVAGWKRAVAESNMRLVEKQYYANTWVFGVMYPEEIKLTQPIR